MKPLFTGWRVAAVCSLLVAPIAIACSSTGAATDSQNLTEELEILFPKMHTAFEEDHDYRVPAKVEGVKNVTWKAEPKDAVKIEVGSDKSEVTITVKKYVPKVKITASSGNLKGTAELLITEATAEQWKEGSERYNNGVVWKRGGRDGGGGRNSDGGRGERKVDPNLSCTNCHNKGGKGGNDVEHTPMQTAGYSDEDLITIFSEGKKPEGVKMRTTTAEKWGKMHKWQMEPEEKQGIIVYLRSLEPETQGELDWGGRGGGRGGGEGRGGDREKGSGDDKGSTSDDKGSTTN